MASQRRKAKLTLEKHDQHHRLGIDDAASLRHVPCFRQRHFHNLNVLALMGMVLLPYLLPQMTKLVTGQNASEESFAEARNQFFRQLLPSNPPAVASSEDDLGTRRP